MRSRIVAFVVGIVVMVAGCTTATDTPATAPTTSVTPSTTSPTTTAPPSTTVAPQTTTTLDRLTEIQVIFEDLEHRRLQAVFDEDESAFRQLYANERYLEESLLLFDAVRFVSRPNEYSVRVTEVLFDSDTCIAVVVETDLTGVTEGGKLGQKQQAIEMGDSGWGISYTGEDWACDGPHPFSG